MRPFNPAERRRYHKVRLDLRASLAARPPLPRITQADLVAALRSAGYDRSPRYVRAVLGEEKVSRPALREISAAVRVIRLAECGCLPDWL